MQDQNSTRFYCNNETKIEQGCEKKRYPKLLLNRLKKWGILFLFIPITHLAQKNCQKNFNPHVAHVHPCVNYAWTKT